MRTTRPGFALALLGCFAACGAEDGRDHAARGGAGRAGTRSDAAGNGNTAGSTAGKSGTAGSFGAAGSNPGQGARSGAAGASGSAGGSNAGSGSSNAGAFNQGGATAGRANAAGASGIAPGGASGGGASGAAGEVGEGGTSAEAGAAGAPNEPVGLSWPIDCVPNVTCFNLGYPDIDGDGTAHDCGDPAYVGHEGTDIGITFEAQAAGTAVRAAADGVVVFAFDGKYDQCPDALEPDCQDPSSTSPGSTTGNTVCTPIGPYCGTGEPGCYWCFKGGNVIVIRHEGVPGVFATRYDHLRKDSVRVLPGDTVTRGQQIAEAGSAGNSTRPHLHFEVWSTGFYELADPWSGPCGPNTGKSLWAYEPPWSE